MPRKRSGAPETAQPSPGSARHEDEDIAEIEQAIPIEVSVGILGVKAVTKAILRHGYARAAAAATDPVAPPAPRPPAASAAMDAAEPRPVDRKCPTWAIC